MYGTGISARKRWSQYEEEQYLLLDDDKYTFIWNSRRDDSPMYPPHYAYVVPKKLPLALQAEPLYYPHPHPLSGILLWKPIKL